MSNFVYILAGIAMLAVLLVMVLGIVSMIKGGEFNNKYGNMLMQMRVKIQGVAIALLALAYFISQS